MVTYKVAIACNTRNRQGKDMANACALLIVNVQLSFTRGHLKGLVDFMPSKRGAL